MSRKVIARNISYDEEKRLYYISMDYGKNETGKRIKTSKTFKTKKEASDALKIFEADKARSRLVLPATDSVESFGCYWLAFEKADIRATTRYTYSVTLNNHIIPYFSGRMLQSVKKEDIFKYFAHLRDDKNLSANTVRKHYSLLRSIFESAEQSEIIYVSPMKGVSVPKPAGFENTVYDLNQIIDLFRAVEGDRLELAVHLAVCLGLRRGEICGLRWENVDLFRRTIDIIDNRTMAGSVVVDGPVKSGASERRLKIPDNLMPFLLAAKSRLDASRRILSEGFNEGDYVLCYKNGRPYRPNYLSQLFSAMLKREGLPHTRFHDMRHAHGSIAILGAPLYDVSKSLGHSRQEITQKIYIKDFIDVKSAAVDSVDGALKSALAVCVY